MSLRKYFLVAGRIIIAAAVLLCSATYAFNFCVTVDADGISGGNGSAGNPYIIISMAGFTSIASNPSAYYTLGCDIDFSGSSWSPICDVTSPFNGVLDGGHHLIENLSISTSISYAGLFICIGSNGTIKNLGIDSGTIRNTNGNAGSFAGQNHGTIENCYSNASISCTKGPHFVGGITAINYGTISNCYNTGGLSCVSTDTAGGIAGSNLGNQIQNCYAIGTFSTCIHGGITGSGGGSLCSGCHFLYQSGMYESADDSTSPTGETSAMLKMESTYTGWDFNNIWTISSSLNNGYPYFLSASTNCNLSAISLSSGILSPAFTPQTTSYTVNVDSGVTQITITPTVADPTATVSVNGVSAATPVSLIVGSNTITITVTAQSGAVQKYIVVVNRAQSSNCDLTAISLSSGGLYPTFAPQTTNYTVNVDNSVSQITVTPTVADPTATVLVNGVSAATPVSLVVGSNTIAITVTAQSGAVQKYIIVVTRAESDNCNLNAISLSSGGLYPTFTPQTTNYTVNVDNGVSQITVTPTVADPNATVSVNGVSEATPVSLIVGSNTITITVTAQSGAVQKYTIVVNRAQSSNCDLTAISISSGGLYPTFTPQTTNYTVNIDNSVTQIIVTPNVADPNATVSVNEASAATPVSLIVGSNTITIEVTAQSGAVQKYIVVVNRAESDNCNLSTISLSSGGLYPAFTPQTTNYTVNVDSGVTQITVTPTAADPTATALVNGVSAATPVSIIVGSNTITITVTAQSGAVQKYTIVVNRTASDNCNLSAISVSSGTLSPDFTPQTTSYTVNLDNSVSQITVTPTVADPTATVLVNGVSATTPVSLVVGSNTITITVTAQSGAVQKYTIVANRAESDNCNLSAISLSSGILSPGFAPQTTSYSVNVDNSVTQITVTSTVADPTATVVVNGNSAATPVSLIVGSNTITITVTAQSGAVQKYIIVVNRAQSSNCDLTAISLSNGGLYPTFTSQTTNYTVNVDNSVTQIAVTPTTADPTATVLVNGASAATPVSLIVGSNTITITVTAQNGAVQKYIVVVNRAESDNCNLSAISVSNGTLSPAFTPQTTNYTVNVDNSVSQVTITPTVADPTAIVLVNGVSAATPVSLIVGSNTITITVTAQSGAVQKYIVVVNRTASDNCDLSAISLSSGTLNPTFAPQTTNYTVNVDNGVSQITVTPTAADPNAAVLVNGVSATTPVSLVVGSNTITITVTAQSGAVQKYIVVVNRAASDNCNLTAISLSSGGLYPAFTPQTTNYTVNVDNSVTQITITPTAADPNATVMVNGVSATTPVSLIVGSNTITITVTAQSGAVQKYITVVNRAESDNCNLTAISLSSGTLNPTFTSQTTSYTVNVDNSVSQITVTPTMADPTATVLVNGVSAATPVSLIVGSNTITIEVTAQSGAVQKYIIVVNRTASDDCDLSVISISSGTLSPDFTPQTTNYTVNVDNSVTQITVTPTAADTTATVMVNGVSAATPVSLVVGSNTIIITVTAQSGAVQKYIIVVNRTASDNRDLTAISLSSGALNPTFTPQTTKYTLNVDNSVSQITVTPTVTDPTATVMVNGVSAATPVSLIVGSNMITITVTAQSGATQTYTIFVTRAGSINNNVLSGLSISSGTLSPAFTPQTTSYTVNVDNSITQIIVTPTAANTNATVLVNGVSAAMPVYLNSEITPITITVTSQSGSIQIYVILVTRAAGTNCNLTSISLSESTLFPIVNPQVSYYIADVDSSVTQIIVTPIAADPTATVFVNGEAASNPVLLNEGSNTITITVTAQSGAVKKYFIYIKRAYSEHISISAPDSSGNYEAEAPDYVALLDKNDLFCFTLGDVDINIPVSELQESLTTGGGSISKSSPPQSDISQILQCKPSGTDVIDAFTIGLSGEINENNSNDGVTIRLPANDLALLSYGQPEICFYDPAAHTFLKMGAVFDVISGTATFQTCNLGTFVILLRNPTDISYNYTVAAGSFFSDSGTNKSFSVTVTNGSASPELFGGQMMVVTTLSSGNQTFSFFELSGDVTTFTVTVDSNAVKSSVYLIQGGFSGEKIPATYANTIFVT